MKQFIKSMINHYQKVSSIAVTLLSQVLNFAGRSYVAYAFFAAGLTKIVDWESTLMLFEYEYSVPLLNFQLAAFLATFGELVFPVLLVLGLATRINAIALSVINIVAVISLEDIGLVALYVHVVWGLILLHIILKGGERIAVDYLVKRRLTQSQPTPATA